jgi:hypothetical protein
MKPIPKPPEPVPGPLLEHFEGGSRVAVCSEQPEMMVADRTFPLESRAGGNCRDWLRHLHQNVGEPLSEAGDAMKRVFKIYQMENRTDRLVGRLVGIEKAMQGEISRERAAAQVLARENKFIKRMLDDRDREFSALQAEFVALRHDWVWRAMRTLRGELGRLRRLFRPSAAGVRTSQQGG